ncbi:glycosyltransferase family 2 protein [Paucilactobacillus sp. N302-9]
MKNVSAVVVTYNRIDKLKKCLVALKSQTYKVNHIIVVDNHSTDETHFFLENQENLNVKTTTENLGGAKGFEIGIKEFYKKTNDEFVWVMDDDTIPEETCLEKLVDANSEVDADLFASNVRWIDGSPAQMNLPSVADDWNKVLNATLINSGLVKIKRASFVSLLITRKIIKEVGYPIGKMFIWGDDTEYTQRISKVADCFFVSNSVVVHEMQQNVGIDIFRDTKNRIWRYFYLFRNRLFNGKRMSKKEFIKQIMKTLLVIFQLLFKAETTFRFKKIGIVIKGTVAGLFFNPTIEIPREVK